MIFNLLVEDQEGELHDLTIVFEQPLPVKSKEMWVCTATWSGYLNGQVGIYGATSFQSAFLALKYVETEISILLSGKVATENGNAWYPSCVVG